MDTQFIGIKQLYKELKDITEATNLGQSFTVVKNSKPVFRIEPIVKIDTDKGKYTMQDLLKLQFQSGEKDLSKKIDRYVYGI